jgi:fluoride exporter
MNDSVTREQSTGSNVDSFWPPRRRRTRPPWSVMSVISAGGALGALARYGLDTVFPAAPTEFPWITFAINTAGGLLIGVLMALATDVWAGRRLIRPFLGVGVLGGFTTFSTYVVDINRLIGARAVGTALAYLTGTLVAALAATYCGLTLARWATSGRRKRRHGEA